MNIRKLPLSSVIFGDRIRQDYGDVTSLANSIRENGIIHPPTLTKRGDTFVLVAGGRRTSAYKMLSEKWPEEYKEFTFNVFEHEVDEADLRLLELTENVERKDMTWQERIRNIAEAHKLMLLKNKAKALKWTQEMTGRELKMSQANISLALLLAEHLKKGNPVVCGAESYMDAYRALLKANGDALNKAYLERLAGQAAPPPLAGPETKAEPITQEGGEGESIESSPAGDPPLKSPESESPQAVLKLTGEHIRAVYKHGDCLALMSEMKNRFNAIISDPPYGIEMSNLKGDNISRVEETHNVQSNLSLLEEFMPLAFDALRTSGFLVLWCDPVHFNFLCEQAEKAGFKPCRWPLVWCKTSSCFNNAPQYNPTKSTEFVFVARKGMATLPRPLTNNFLIEPNIRHDTHPFFKPKAVWDWLYNAFCLEGQEVLDPFAGEGSSLVSALSKKLVPTALELEEKHINNAVLSLPPLINKNNALADFFSE